MGNEVKQLQSLHASWNDRKVKYNRHFSAIKAVLDLTWETLTCYECEHNPAWPDQSGYCFRHSSLIGKQFNSDSDYCILKTPNIVDYYNENALLFNVYFYFKLTLYFTFYNCFISLSFFHSSYVLGHPL